MTARNNDKPLTKQYNINMPQDPKPNLSREAIMANISYCKAKQDHHMFLVKQFKQKEQEYAKMLYDLGYIK
jgi:hypothetical protein